MKQQLITIFACLLISWPLGAIGAVERQVPVGQKEMLLSFAPVVKQVAPAVVNIYAKKKVRVRQLSLFDRDPLFGQLFGDNLFRGFSRERLENSLGSGVIIDPSGLVITNYHVIQGGEEITVVLADKREFEARVVVVDKQTDLAVLKIDAVQERFAYLEFFDSDQLEVGDIVLAIGNPFGVGQTVTSGIVSAVARTQVGISDYQFFIQTDAAINPGNSGGALVTLSGKLAGINTAIFSKSGGSHGIGFATPSNMAKIIFSSAQQGGEIVRPWLGASMQSVTQEIADSLGLMRPSGALVKQLHPLSPAAKAGIKVGDVITKVQGRVINDERELYYRIATFEVGKKVAFTIIRAGKEQEVYIPMQSPPEIPERDEQYLTGEHVLDGATVANLSPALAEALEINILEEGVVIVGIDPRRFVRRIGAQKGDIIVSINGIKMQSTGQLVSQLEKFLKDRTVRGWDIKLKRDGRVINIMVAR